MLKSLGDILLMWNIIFQVKSYSLTEVLIRKSRTNPLVKTQSVSKAPVH